MIDLTFTGAMPVPTHDIERIHTDIVEYLTATAAYDMVFMPSMLSCRHEIAGVLLSMQGAAVLHVFEEHRVIGIHSLENSDVPLLSQLGGNLLIRAISSLSRENSPPPALRILAGAFRIFFETGSPLASAGHLRYFREITLTEYLLSSPPRLASYPTISLAALAGNGTGHARMRVVIVLDLIQDFEVLRPLIARCAENYAWSNLCISVSDRVITSHLWPQLSAYLEAMQLSWFKPVSPIDVINALGTARAVLITASETSANGHKFSHMVCQLAHRNTLKITIQHGFECVGLRHHQAHDASLPEGVRFASDIVLTWSTTDQLGNIHPSDREKCLPVGIVKSSAQESAVQDHIRKRLLCSHESISTAGAKRKVLVAENLHSVRFDTNRYQRFLDFIRGLQNNRSVQLTLRSHPGKRTLEQDQLFSDYAFLTGTLRAGDFHAFATFVSPPSTIVLDAVLAGVPTAIWSVRSLLGDCENYTEVPVVGVPADLDKLHENIDARHLVLDNYRWALNNVCAINGIPQAWSRMNELAFAS